MIQTSDLLFKFFKENLNIDNVEMHIMHIPKSSYLIRIEIVNIYTILFDENRCKFTESNPSVIVDYYNEKFESWYRKFKIDQINSDCN